MQHLDLTDDEAAALTQELHDIVENDRYPSSPRIRTLRGILAKLRPEPVNIADVICSVREPLPPPKVYAPPSKGRYRCRPGQMMPAWWKLCDTSSAVCFLRSRYRLPRWLWFHRGLARLKTRLYGMQPGAVTVTPILRR
jgi:hypothetical protein